MYPFEIHTPARAQQQSMDSFAAIARIPLAPATQLINQSSFIVRLMTLVALRRARLTQDPAKPAF
jgi:hypothetical protein